MTSRELLLALSADPSRCFPEVAKAAVASLDRIGTSNPLGLQFLGNLLRALQRLENGALRDAAAEKIASRPEIFSPVTLVVPALEQIFASDDRGVVLLWTAAAEFLLGRSEAPPEPPSDWRMNVTFSCSCQDCRELQAFALDPAERVHRFRVKKERRQHLHHVIDRHRLDMTHETERVGSPQTLVCTKDRRTFDRRVKQYLDEIAAMRALAGLTPSPDGAAALSGRMRAAVKRAREL